MNKMPKQPTLAHFAGFTKTIVHRGEDVPVTLPTMAKELKEECDICNKRFKNKAGLSVHLKCVHGSDGKVVNDKVTQSRDVAESESTATAYELGMDGPPPSVETDDEDDGDDVMDRPPPSVETDDEDDNGDDAELNEPSTSAQPSASVPKKGGRRGQAKRTAHSVAKKVCHEYIYQGTKDFS
jgi:hypothetical protein